MSSMLISEGSLWVSLGTSGFQLSSNICSLETDNLNHHVWTASSAPSVVLRFLTSSQAPETAQHLIGSPEFPWLRAFEVEESLAFLFEIAPGFLAGVSSLKWPKCLPSSAMVTTWKFTSSCVAVKWFHGG